MNLESAKQFCNLFYASHYIPVFLFGEGEQPLYSCSSLQNLEPAHYVKKNLRSERAPSIFFSSETGFWAEVCINDSSLSVIIGPVFSGECGEEMIHGFMHWHAFPSERKAEISDFIKSIPRYSYYRFLNLISYLHFTFNGESIDMIEHFDQKRKEYDSVIGAMQAEQSIASMENNTVHGTYQLEQRLLDFIRDGKTEELKSFLSLTLKTEKLSEGKLAENPIRQAKNIFIGTATMFGKVGAIKGGLDIEQTYQLIDSYIQECELLSTLEEITALQYNMLIDFTSRVAESKIPEGISEDIFLCIQYISNHVNEAIGIDDLSRYVGKSRAYLTDKFKRETSKTINEYIIDKKLLEAKSLLKHTNKSLAEIAYFLSFSSQAYFQSIFKAHFNETPGAYRKRFHKQ